jgi:cytochrome c-type biogenesis protein CcmH
MLLFSLAAALFAAAAVALVLWRAARPAQAAVESPEAAVYARQLAELDAEKAQGMLDEAGWRAARAEAGRRLLGAARRSGAEREAVAPRDRWIVLGVAVAAVAVAGGVYLAEGRPGRPDAPFAARLARWDKTPLENLDPERQAAVLELRSRAQPNDLALRAELALAYANQGRFPQAATAFEQVLERRPDALPVWVALGEVLMDENDGRMAPDARAAFEHALKLDPHSPGPLWWLGRDDVLAGRRDQGLARWRMALAGLRADDPRRAGLENAIAAAESGRFGQAETVAAAPPQAQMAMIRGMVQRLADRLQHEHGQASDWARLVRAYGVLGDAAARDRALARARQLFAGRPQELEQIEAAARSGPGQP